MARLTELTWYKISEAVPRENVFVLIRLTDDPNNIYRAKRIAFPGARYGFLFTILNDFKLEQLPDERVDEFTAFCPASVIEWAYLVA